MARRHRSQPRGSGMCRPDSQIQARSDESAGRPGGQTPGPAASAGSDKSGNPGFVGIRKSDLIIVSLKAPRNPGLSSATAS